MLFNWVTIFHELIETERSRGRPPLSDPLERPEWRGLGWTFAEGRRSRSAINKRRREGRWR